VIQVGDGYCSIIIAFSLSTLWTECNLHCRWYDSASV